VTNLPGIRLAELRTVLHLDSMIHAILAGNPNGFKFSRLNINRDTVYSMTDGLISSPQGHFAGRRRDTTLTTGSNDARARAEASFRKEERAKEGAKAMMEYQAHSRMVREKTERLKALRLAKEAEDKKRAGD